MKINRSMEKLKFISLNEWIISRSINEGGNAIALSRPVTFEEGQEVINYIKYEVLPHLNISEDLIDTIGSFGKKRMGEKHGDIDIVIDKEALKKLFNLDTDKDLVEYLGEKFKEMGFDVNEMPGLNQVSIGVDIPGSDGVAQVDFMLSPNLDWSKFIYHSPDFRNNESEYKGIYRNALLMAIISEANKQILKKTPGGETEEMEYDVVRLPGGIWRARKSFMGKKGLTKAGQILREFDKLITLDPQKVVEMAVGGEYGPEDIGSVESLWEIINSPDYIHRDKLDSIKEKFLENLASMRIEIPDFAK